MFFRGDGMFIGIVIALVVLYFIFSGDEVPAPKRVSESKKQELIRSSGHTDNLSSRTVVMGNELNINNTIKVNDVDSYQLVKKITAGVFIGRNTNTKVEKRLDLTDELLVDNGTYYSLSKAFKNYRSIDSGNFSNSNRSGFNVSDVVQLRNGMDYLVIKVTFNKSQSTEYLTLKRVKDKKETILALPSKNDFRLVDGVYVRRELAGTALKSVVDNPIVSINENTQILKESKKIISTVSGYTKHEKNYKVSESIKEQFKVSDIIQLRNGMKHVVIESNYSGNPMIQRLTLIRTEDQKEIEIVGPNKDNYKLINGVYISKDLKGTTLKSSLVKSNKVEIENAQKQKDEKRTTSVSFNNTNQKKETSETFSHQNILSVKGINNANVLRNSRSGFYVSDIIQLQDGMDYLITRVKFIKSNSAEYVTLKRIKDQVVRYETLSSKENFKLVDGVYIHKDVVGRALVNPPFKSNEISNKNTQIQKKKEPPSNSRKTEKAELLSQTIMKKVEKSPHYLKEQARGIEFFELFVNFESEIRNFLNANKVTLVDPDLLIKKNMNFRQMTDVLYSSDLISYSMYEEFQNLNKTRNLIAHGYMKQIEKEKFIKLKEMTIEFNRITTLRKFGITPAKV